MIYILISLIIFTAYVVGVWITFGVLKSISDSYYHIKNKWLFTIALQGFAIPVILAGENIWLFFAGAGICLVGVASQFKLKQEGNIHYIAAVLGIIFGTIWLFVSGLWYLGIALIVLIILLRFVKNYTWWQEIAAYYIILLGLLLIKL